MCSVYHLWRATNTVMKTYRELSFFADAFLVKLIEVRFNLAKELVSREILSFNKQYVVVAQGVRHYSKIVIIDFN